MRSPRRMGVALAVAAALLSAGCAAGQHAETAEEHPTLDGTTATVGNMALRAIAILPPSSASYARGSSPQLRLVLVNTGRDPDQLTSITSPDASGWGSYASAAQAAAAANPNPTKPQPTKTGPVTVPAGGAVRWGVPENPDSKTLLLLNIKEQLYPASTIPITFTFANAGSVTASVPVQISVNPPASYISPPPTPEPNPT